ncbi:MAG TPA: hypothetical protein VMG10_33620 [Gemmataceae bacterium]|nr:hypothetical protein [Gemmataceae bacterium]
MNLSIPIYVEALRAAGGGAIYQARPLFFADPIARGERLERLLARLAQDIDRQLGVLGRQMRHEELAAWAFAPPLRTHRLDLTLTLRRRTAHCRFLFVSFRHFGRRLAFTPSVPEVWFDLSRGETLTVRAAEVLTRHFRDRERNDGDSDPEALAVKGMAYVAPLEIAVRPPVVPPEPPRLRFLMLGGEAPANGADELRRVGRCLDWQYPDELARVVRRDAELVELTRLLDAGEHRPILLTGPCQVGKTALLEEFVYRRVEARGSAFRDRGNVWLLAPSRKRQSSSSCSRSSLC